MHAVAFAHERVSGQEPDPASRNVDRGSLVRRGTRRADFRRGNYVAAARLSPWPPWWVMAPLLALSVLLYRRVILPKAAMYLDGRKEILIKVLA